MQLKTNFEKWKETACKILLRIKLPKLDLLSL